jgi:hypothetical protein
MYVRYVMTYYVSEKDTNKPEMKKEYKELIHFSLSPNVMIFGAL